MKRLKHLLSLLILIAFAWWSFKSLLPSEGSSANVSLTQFSTERAMRQLREISSEPHYVGSKAHKDVRDYIISELTKLGLQPQIQEGFVLDSWGGANTLVKAQNIVARFKGTSSSKSLLLMSHYDSAPHSKSYGASDAGSGVVTILETLRAYFSGDEKPANDIIVLFTDAEELGLDGASLFVREHPWAKNVGVALNFEARGSSGPSNMIVETNGGNAQLIQAFHEAEVEFPVATSLMYSIYKMLPNDTDSTVLREEGDIPGFFFAFIDSHFNYHTVNDRVENLDPRTLEHQGSYLLPLVKYFSQIDLSQMKTTKDDVYFDAPLFTFVSYPFSWIWPMVAITVILFLFLTFIGVRNKRLRFGYIGRGFLALLLSLLAPLFLMQLFSWIWPSLYPQYEDMLPVFIYNGHWYTIAFVVMTLSICFGLYKYFCKSDQTASAFVAPLFFWILINILIAIFLKGAAYFIVPVMFGLVSYYALVSQKKPNIFLMLFLCAPAIFIFAPLIQFFPVGLGPEAYWISIVFTVLLFGLLLPVVGRYKSKNMLSYVGFAITLILLGIAHGKSDYTPERQKPNSLVYYIQNESKKAYWLTYDTHPDPWVKKYLGDTPEKASKYVKNSSGSKYNSSFQYANEAPMVALENATIIKTKDQLVGENREVTLLITPQRSVNRLRLFSNVNTPFRKLIFNQKEYKPDSTETLFKKRRNNDLLGYYLGDGEELEFTFAVPAGINPELRLREYSFDLLENPVFRVSDRPDFTMPAPFVTTDAVIVDREINLDLLTLIEPKKDSVSDIDLSQINLE
ncbi:M28 family peptidase [Dokdonia sp. Hel_I_53]|uniref:M28 family peptidase n=1 Tax=Dokdonia sp. Hel_I_53 TaxID=1566287 RepID=UPI00119A6F8D|nr:M28 family peptidase [Dokdonia sp. Hel_I_53]TVZ52720.1 peptidase M28-like protein [Dokdonia sp. Hel_I_53]